MLSPVAIKNGVCPHSCCSSALVMCELLIILFEVRSASIATRATDLIGIHESDNGRKEE